MTRKRRDPYERAFAAAVKRREKAIQERNRCLEKLNALEEEIPRLDGIIAVLGTKQPYPTAQEPAPIGESTGMETVAATTPLKLPGLPGGVPAHLEKYLRQVIRPSASQVIEPTATDEDDNLPPIGGEPILE